MDKAAAGVSRPRLRLVHGDAREALGSIVPFSRQRQAVGA